MFQGFIGLFVETIDFQGEKKKGAKINAFCDPAGIRTQDPYIKSVLLYQLSYGILSVFESDAKVEFLSICSK